MKLRKFLMVISLFLVLAASSNLYAEQSDDTKQNQGKIQADSNSGSNSSFIGFSGSSISGAGLSCQYIFNDNYRIAFTGIYLYADHDITGSSDYNKDVEYEEDYNFGLELQKTVFSANTGKRSVFRVYVMCGAAFWSLKESGHYVSGGLPYYDHNRYYSAGIALGANFLLANHIYVGAHAGYNFEYNIEPKSKRYAGFGGGGGLGFEF